MRLVLLLLLASSLYGALAYNARRPPELEAPRVDMLLPIVPNLLAFLGDRYLAANMGYVRAVTLPPEETSEVDARVILQQQVAAYNPKHEDNYYLAASSFPWEGRVEVAQSILAEAAKARTWDAMPYFLMGLNAGNHQSDLILAANYIAKAADREQGKNKSYFKELAAHLFTKTDNLDYALAHTEMLAQGSTSPKISRMMQARAERIRGLIVLRRSADDYRSQFNSPLAALSDLVSAGILDRLPEDPTGLGYGLAEDGTPGFKEQVRARN